MEEFSCPSECEEAEGKAERKRNQDSGEDSAKLRYIQYVYTVNSLSARFYFVNPLYHLCIYSSVAKLSVLWSGSARKTPLIVFRADAILGLDGPVDHPFSGNTCIIENARASRMH